MYAHGSQVKYRGAEKKTMTRETLLPQGGGSFAGTPTCTLTGAHTPKVLHIVTSENTQVDFMQIIYVIGHNLY